MKTIHLNNRTQHLLGCLLFISALILYYQKAGLIEKITSRPRGEHLWAQCDRASMALTYYMDKAPFFLPRCHQATQNTEGITAGEFPLIPYIASKFYCLFGFNEIYFRLLVLFTAIIGFFFSYLITRKFIDHWFWSFFIAVIWLASPNLIYYSFSFLPDITGLSLILISTYFLIKTKTGPTYIDLILFSVFFSLAGLIRVSSIIPLCAISAAFFVTGWKTKLVGVRKKMFFVFGCIFSGIVTFSWIYYAKWIFNKYKILTFAMDPMPPGNNQQLMEGINIFLARTDMFYMKEFFIVLAIFSIMSLFFIRKTNWFLLLSAIFCYAGFIFMFYELFEKSVYHAYYWVPFQVAIFLHILWIANSLRHIKLNQGMHVIVATAALVFINFNSIHIHKNVNKRWKDFGEMYTPYYDLEKYLETVGIKYSDRILSYSDETFNNTLYLMDRKGWTIHKGDSENNHQRAFNSCDYAVLNDTAIVRDPVWGGYFKRRIGEHKGVFIYELR